MVAALPLLLGSSNPVLASVTPSAAPGKHPAVATTTATKTRRRVASLRMRAEDELRLCVSAARCRRPTSERTERAQWIFTPVRAALSGRSAPPARLLTATVLSSPANTRSDTSGAPCGPREGPAQRRRSAGTHTPTYVRWVVTRRLTALITSGRSASPARADCYRSSPAHARRNTNGVRVARERSRRSAAAPAGLCEYSGLRGAQAAVVVFARAGRGTLLSSYAFDAGAGRSNRKKH